MRITDEAVKAALLAVADTGKGTHRSERIVRKILNAALPHLSQGAVSVKPLEWDRETHIGWHEADSEFGTYRAYADGTVTFGIMGSRLPISYKLGRSWPDMEADAQADYERRILSALSPAPVGVTDEMVLKFITTSRDEDAGYQNWTEAVTAGLKAALSSHEPAPSDAKRGEQRTICEACGRSNIAHDRAVWTEDGSSFCPSCAPTDTQEGVSERREPIAILQYARNVPGRENEMPRVVSCNWLPDGDYPVYLHPDPALTACQQEVGRLQKEGERQRLSFTMQQEDLRHFMRKADEAEARIAELVKALEPFAFSRCNFDFSRWDEETKIEVHLPRANPRKAIPTVWFNVEHVLKARAALGGQSNE